MTNSTAAVIGVLALQDRRLAAPSLGEGLVVTRLDLVGMITAPLLCAHGCRVLGVDYDGAKIELARGYGAEIVALSKSEDLIAAARVFSRGGDISPASMPKIIC